MIEAVCRYCEEQPQFGQVIKDSNWNLADRSKKMDTAWGSSLGHEPTETSLWDINLDVTGYVGIGTSFSANLRASHTSWHH